MNIIGMNVDNIEHSIKTTQLLVAYFSHDECQVCKVLRPKVKTLIDYYKKIEFLYVDTKAFPQIIGQHLVFAVPTIIVFTGGREQRRYSRHFSFDEFATDLERLNGLIF